MAKFRTLTFEEIKQLSPQQKNDYFREIEARRGSMLDFVYVILQQCKEKAPQGEEGESYAPAIDLSDDFKQKYVKAYDKMEKKLAKHKAGQIWLGFGGVVAGLAVAIAGSLTWPIILAGCGIAAGTYAFSLGRMAATRRYEEKKLLDLYYAETSKPETSFEFDDQARLENGETLALTDGKKRLKAKDDTLALTDGRSQEQARLEGPTEVLALPPKRSKNKGADEQKPVCATVEEVLSSDEIIEAEAEVERQREETAEIISKGQTSSKKGTKESERGTEPQK